MLVRFCLYGFLKNQLYFESFLLLALLERGMGYLDVGLLFGFREFCIYLLEIPSGAAADLYGRRRTLQLSFVAYILSFLLLWGAGTGPWLYLAMLLFGFGEAFRSGTHKTMIFRWLANEGRQDEKTAIYGVTRSWSKIGSAVSVVVASLVVFWTGSFQPIILLSVLPYIAGLINQLGYPASVDLVKTGADRPRLAEVYRLTYRTIVDAIQLPALRRMLLESMSFEGLFDATRPYLQPVLKASAVLLLGHFVWTADWTDATFAACLVGPVYAVIYLGAAYASRRAGDIATALGGEQRAARRLWWLNLLACAVILAGGVSTHLAWTIPGFLALTLLQNVWRPVLVTRLYEVLAESRAATVLSVESQGQRLVVMLAAPLLGWAVDLATGHGLGGGLWPVGLAGVLTAAGVLLLTAGPGADATAPDTANSK